MTKENKYLRVLEMIEESESRFALGARVKKKSGSKWQGRVVGYYSTDLTPWGCAVESEFHPGSVQIYPMHALELIGKE